MNIICLVIHREAGQHLPCTKLWNRIISDDFNLDGSVCGAGPYNIYLLLQGMINVTTYPMPVYIGYIVNAYSAYNQFTNPVTDIFNEPYASRTKFIVHRNAYFSQINNQLTTSIPDLITPDFFQGLSLHPNILLSEHALNNNSISAWHTYKPLLFFTEAKILM